MPKGGARARSGPAPNPNALRRERDAGQWVDLPRAGRAGPPPAWPLPKQTKRERELWVRLWASPQAVMWEAHEQVLEVAVFVRSFREGEQAGATVALRTLIRQQMEALGLSQPGLLRNRWRIVDQAAAPAPADAPAAGLLAAPVSVKDRLKVVAGAS